ncbi:Nicotinamide-nucleotide amidohydrolase PncC [Aquicella siphonis]|uniref:Nicotinamide-nucleotide amidohydrolase PncC n=1 Tax=Aquicella siphonis TaxID=254247 RepID=A0A5E4PGS9_9COXI|nr:CinA family protein [Aquicella siphonis]VVC76250.1 Nicotinamide-nucleotide amidohydrolase PncC [Aquicella siphonis]
MIETLKKLVLETARTLQERGYILTTAESCTGGGLSYWLTSVPGSSDWFDRGYVTYSNDAKTEMLQVDPVILENQGAVSEAAARAMAEGALRNSRANISIAITGIAGPDGGTAEKPVGTVWIAWSGKYFNTLAQHFVFTGDRQSIRLASMASALEKLIELARLQRSA